MRKQERFTKAKRLYTKITIHRRFMIFLLLFLVPLTFIINICLGPSNLSPFSIIRALVKSENVSRDMYIIIWYVRLPVALAALVVGAALGLAGAEMQTILDNPLASPYTLGISAGAAFGAALAYVYGISALPHISIYIVPINAFIFALLTSALVYILSSIRGFSAEALILAGIAVNYLFHALLALMEYLASEETLQAIVFWLFGSLYKATWEKIAIVFSGLILSLLLLLPNALKLTALRLGDDVAATLGVNVKRTRILVFLASSLLTATAVCFYGIIGFVGLVAPHIARMLVGEDQRYLIPASMLTGALVLSSAAIAGKSVIPGAIIPIGIVTSLVGVPFFLLLVIKERRRYW